MTDLSPAAQAVLDAFENASDGEYVEGVWVVNERTMLAAALRAVADRMDCRDLGDPRDQWEQGFFVGVRSAKDELLTIAAELEGADQSTSSTR